MTKSYFTYYNLRTDSAAVISRTVRRRRKQISASGSNQRQPTVWRIRRCQNLSSWTFAEKKNRGQLQIFP